LPNEHDDVFVAVLMNGQLVKLLQYPELKDRTWHYVVGEFDGPVEVGLRFQTSYRNSRDCFTDSWKAEEIETMPDCNGLPRVQYHRTVVLLPPTAVTPDWAAAISEATIAERWTILYSADDAGIGDLTDKDVISVNPGQWRNPPDDGTALERFFADYYPGIGYLGIDAVNPDELKTKLDALLGNDADF
jgi:hypothetical protein